MACYIKMKNKDDERKAHHQRNEVDIGAKFLTLRETFMDSMTTSE